MAQKTLFLFLEVPEQHFFFEMEGDFSRFDGIFINGTCSQKCCSEQSEYEPVIDCNYDARVSELFDIVYNDKTGKVQVTKLDKPTKDWDFFVNCGFFL